MRALFLIIALLLSSGYVSAGHVIGLYDVEILVVDESSRVRQQAFDKGLDEVFIRISGDSIVMDKLKRPSSSRYVKQFSYEPVQNPITNERGQKLTQRLKIHYNGSLMEKYLQDNGFPVWGEHRPDVVIWLAVRDGRNQYVLKDADRSQLKTATTDALTRRGIPERWPIYDAKDRKILNVADIRGGFKEPLAKASKRYSRGPALAGSLIWNGKEWQSSWSLLLPSENRHWSVVSADYNVLINKAINQAADALGVVFALHGAANKQQLARVRLNIQAVNSVERYRHVESYLTNLSSVQGASPLKIDGQSAVFEVTLRSTEEDFLNLIHNDAELIKVEAIKPEAIKPEAIKPEAIKPVEKTPLIPEIKPLLDVPMTTGESETVAETVTENEATVLLNQQSQVPVYYYKLRN